MKSKYGMYKAVSGVALLGLVGLLSGCPSGGSGGGTSAIQMGGAVQGGALTLTGTVSTMAGTAPGADGTGAAASFSSPLGIINDGSNLYVADAGSNKIRKIVIATGVVSTLAGSGAAGAADGPGTAATFSSPTGLTTDGTNLFVTDRFNNKIRKIVIATGAVSSLTGTANTQGATGAADGPASAATFNWPSGIVIDGGSLYVVDGDNNKIRKIVIANAAVSSLTGAANTAGAPGAADGAGLAATFNSPRSITTDGTNLYVADAGNNKIRKIVIANAAVSSLTGTANTQGATGAADGLGSAATFNWPSGIFTDGTSLYVAEAGNNKIRKIVIANVAVSSLTGVANTAGVTGAADGDGTAATFNSPQGITSDGTNLYVADESNNTIRKIALSTDVVSTLAGTAPGTDGTGAAASFNYPDNVTSDGANLYVADEYDNKIRKIAIATGVVSTLAGSGAIGAADGPGTAATFSSPTGITTDGTNLFVTDRFNNKIRKIVIATGAVSSLTGTTNTQGTSGAADGPGTAATFTSPTGITTDGTNLFVTDRFNNKIRKIVIATRAVSSLTGVWSTAGATGAMDGPGSAATFSGPGGITTDGTNLYVADTGNNKIRQIVITTGAVSSLTGVWSTTGATGAMDGPGSAATFSVPGDITTDGTNLYVADTGNNKIRQIVIATGTVSGLTGVANTAGVAGAADGSGTAATFNTPQGITSDGTSLYLADSYNNTIRKIQ